MAKAKRGRRTTTLRRSCGAMAAHMVLLEQYPSFRAEPDAARGRDGAAPRHRRST